VLLNCRAKERVTEKERDRTRLHFLLQRFFFSLFFEFILDWLSDFKRHDPLTNCKREREKKKKKKKEKRSIFLILYREETEYVVGEGESGCKMC